MAGLRRVGPWVAASALAAIAAGGEGVERIGRLDDERIVEASGIVRSRRHRDTYWVHNDSGNPPKLFAVRRDGTLIRAYDVAIPNIDWEDIATDDAGHLYLADTGNNGLKLPIRAVHRLDEPDPTAPDDRRPVRVDRSTYYRFGEGGRFDSEGLFVDGGVAYLVAKHRDGKVADLYRLSLDPPSPLLRPATPERVGALDGCTEPVTGADLSADGALLAVVTDVSARVYRRDERGGWASLASVRHGGKDVEAIAWDGLDLILAGEDREIARIAESNWRRAGR